MCQGEAFYGKAKEIRRLNNSVALVLIAWLYDESKKSTKFKKLLVSNAYEIFETDCVEDVWKSSREAEVDMRHFYDVQNQVRGLRKLRK